jgi:hypothetical protein
LPDARPAAYGCGVTPWLVLVLVGLGAFGVAVLAARPVARRGDTPTLLLQAGVVGSISLVPVLRRLWDGDGLSPAVFAGVTVVFVAWCAGVLGGFRLARRVR